MAKATDGPDKQVVYWKDQIEKAKKRFKGFHDLGDQIVDVYRQQKADGNDNVKKDRYNILYSSTETIRPNLYAQTPTVRVKLRNKDRTDPPALMAAMLLESDLEYLVEESDFDDLMESVVEDLLLPGLGTAWARYEPSFEPVLDDKSKPVLDENGEPQQRLLDEMVVMEYTYWQDWLCGNSRGWKTVPWVSRRLWLSKDKATRRFGAKKANELQYTTREGRDREMDTQDETAEVWEIWDKGSRTVFWLAETGMLDIKKDPLHLKNFFPCPRPVRAISNNRTFVPRALYTQYKSQAETLDVLTRRIRLLGEALRVVGLYNAASPKVSDMLNPAAGNKMIAVDDWAMFAEKGGIKGQVDWLPLDSIVNALTQLIQAREVCKQEIYEITGFSDIVRGVSKASETLGAQNLKANWAGARVKKAQKEVQRFARDLIAIAGEILAEHCEPATIALFAGITLPSPEELQNPESPAQQTMQTFQAATAIIKSDASRISKIDIETDSTILADEEAERKDRMEFLGAAGAFLQQAVPAMQSAPEIGELLGAMLMFTVRTFPSSRPIEEAFERVQKMMLAKPPTDPNADPNGHAAKANATKEVAGMKLQADQARIDAEMQRAQAEGEAKQALETQKLALASQEAQWRHEEAMAKLAGEAQFKERELELREREVSVKEAELGIKKQQADTQEMSAVASAETAERQADTAEATAIHGAEMQERTAEHTEAKDIAQHELEKENMDRADANAAADRDLTKDKD